MSAEMVDQFGLPFDACLLKAAETLNFCPRCEGDGSTSDWPDCTTGGPDCACMGPSVVIDPCPLCGGSGEWTAPS